MAATHPSYPLSQIRPTLIIGLGGSGYQIAVNLKARLVEQYGEGEALESAVRFVCIDTANENFSAVQPNTPDAAPVTLSRETEYVRISDIPLHDLMQRRDENPAIASILPDRLRSTHIDQGAQQIRRLGRVALLYRYDRVRGRLSTAISALLSIQNQRASDRRLRVIIACSICGGTGSGTFIDVAYLVRHIAMTDGTAKSARDIDVVGMLLLPEVFRSVRTSGEERIRANAYAALLDLEYFNQATNVETPLYSITGMAGGKIEIEGAPYDQCFLINASEGGTVKGVRELAPILADSLMLMIASRVGEQLTATFDNLKTNNLTRYYPPGYRAFYSSIGMAQIIQPRQWLSRRFALEIKKMMLDDYLLAAEDSEDARRRANNWLKQSLNATVDKQLRKGPDGAARDLLDSWDVVVRSARTEADLVRGWKNLASTYFSEYEPALQERQYPALNAARQALSQMTERTVARIARDPQAPAETAAENGFGGLKAAARWLESVRNALYAEITLARGNYAAPDFDGEARRVAGPRVSRADLARSLTVYLERITSADQGAHLRVRIDVLEALLEAVRDEARRVGAALQAWVTLRANLETQLRQDAPQLTSVSQSVIDREAIDGIMSRRLDKLKGGDATGALYNDLLQALPHFANCLPEDGRLLEAYALPETLTAALEAFCRDRSGLAIASERSVAQQMARRADSDGEAGMRRRDKMMQQWMNQAKPFLSYREGLIADLRISTVRVIGVQSDEDDTALGDSVDRSDTAVVSTEEAERLTLLHTEHGVPMHVLRNIDEYRQRYLELASERDAMLHMSRELERAPYDPGSSYFLDLEDFDLYLARAFAYRWLLWDTAKRCFAISRPFYDALSDMVENEHNRLSTEDAKARERLGQLSGLSSKQEAQKLEQIRLTQIDLDRRMAALVPKEASQTDQSHASAGVVLVNLPLTSSNALLPASTVELVRQALLGQGTLLFARLFQRTFAEFEEKPGFKAREGISHFLTQRKYFTDEGYETGVAKQPPSMVWSKPGEPSYTIELRFCALLAAFEQAVVRTQRVGRRKLRSGYWLPTPFDLQIQRLVIPPTGGEEA